MQQSKEANFARGKTSDRTSDMHEECHMPYMPCEQVEVGPEQDQRSGSGGVAEAILFPAGLKVNVGLNTRLTTDGRIIVAQHSLTTPSTSATKYSYSFHNHFPLETIIIRPRCIVKPGQGPLHESPSVIEQLKRWPPTHFLSRPSQPNSLAREIPVLNTQRMYIPT